MRPIVKQYVDKLGDLPALPETANQLMLALRDPGLTAGTVRAILERDPGIVTRLLRVANSALYGFSREIGSIDRAIAVLGMRNLKDLVLALSLRDLFPSFGLMERRLFDHSTIGALTAPRLARELQLHVPPEDAFLLGLLHDIGKFVFAIRDGPTYERVAERVYREGIAFATAEREEFGFDHSEIGAVVAERWRLPSRLEVVIRCHHDPEAWRGLPAGEGQLVLLVALNSALLTRIGVGRPQPVEGLEVTQLPVWQALGLGVEDEPRLLKVVGDEADRGRALSA